MFGRQQKPAQKGLNIIIVGCGRGGSTLTERLYKEGHNITIVDQDAEKVQELGEEFDVMTVVGNGVGNKTQKDAGIDSADLMIAVTDSDELNLLCCTVAKRVRNCATIARVRSPEYSDDIPYLQSRLGLAMIINPDQVAARQIFNFLNFPAALSVNTFAKGHADIIRFKIPEGNCLSGKKIMDLGDDITKDVLICAVERDKSVYIPDGNFELRTGDEVSFISSIVNADKFFYDIGIDNSRVKDVMIVGGGKTAYYLANRLLDLDIGVKIIEKDRGRCEELSSLLPGAVVIYGDGTDDELLKEEGIEFVDAFIPLTGMDEENILLTLHAKEVSSAKAITKLDRNIFQNIVNKLDIGSVVYPRYLAAEAIVGYVRAFNASKDSNVETMYEIMDSRAEAIEFHVNENSEITNVPLKNLKFKPNLLVTCIYRSGKVIIPGGTDSIQTGDEVIIVTSHTGFRNLEDILA